MQKFKTFAGAEKEQAQAALHSAAKTREQGIILTIEALLAHALGVKVKDQAKKHRPFAAC